MFGCRSDVGVALDLRTVGAWREYGGAYELTILTNLEGDSYVPCLNEILLSI